MQLVTQVYQERERSGSRISVTRKFSGRVWKPVFFMLRADRMGLYKDVRKLEEGYNAQKEYEQQSLTDVWEADKARVHWQVCR